MMYDVCDTIRFATFMVSTIIFTMFRMLLMFRIFTVFIYDVADF